MKTDIILAGVGGQGILSIAAAIGTAALNNELYIKQAETHGMSQRGGAVVSHLRISDKPIYSDLISEGEADLILAVEPLEALRYLPYLATKGYIVTNTTPFVNIPDYPTAEEIMKQLHQQTHLVAIDADKVAEDLGNKLASNMVMLGAAARFLNHIDLTALEKGIAELFSRKGEEVVKANIDAIHAGKTLVDKQFQE
ncbi:MAG: indolepyruvate oxidoreductase subunit beta [Salinivirgaceae bacterium]|nr:indolepyruvate oxidoreductase subunit beta [Salinivirgaceae bacterium]